MLVLTRRESEETIITVPPSAEPTKIVVKIVELQGRKVRVGFIADRHINIVRREVLETEGPKDG